MTTAKPALAPLATPDSFSIRLRIDQLAFSKGPENTAIPLDKKSKVFPDEL